MMMDLHECRGIERAWKIDDAAARQWAEGRVEMIESRIDERQCEARLPQLLFKDPGR